MKSFITVTFTEYYYGELIGYMAGTRCTNKTDERDIHNLSSET